MARGTLILVVGPSGAGKDCLIAAARAARPDLGVARRVITRAPEPGDEPSVCLDRAAFDALRRAGRLALAWEAHGLAYGLRGDLAAHLRSGRTVLANVSRSVVARAAARFRPCRVIHVTAPAEVLAARLTARGRETQAAIAARLARPAPPLPPGLACTEVPNAGAFDAAVAAFMAAVPPPPADGA